MTFMAISGIFYTIRWKYYLHLHFQIVPTNNFEQIKGKITHIQFNK